MIKNFIVLIQLSYFLGIKQIFATEFIYKYKSNFLKNPLLENYILDVSMVGTDKKWIKIRTQFTKVLEEETNSKIIIDFEECNIFVTIKKDLRNEDLQDLSQERTENILFKGLEKNKEAANSTDSEKFILDFEFDIIYATNTEEFVASLNDKHFFFIHIRYNNNLNQLTLRCPADISLIPVPIFSAPPEKQEKFLKYDDLVPFELIEWGDNVEIEKEHKRSEEEISVDKTINNKKEKSYWKSPSGKMLAIHASISWIGFIIPMLCFASTML